MLDGQAPARSRHRGGWIFLAGVVIVHGALALVDGGLAALARASFVKMLREVAPVLALVFGLLFLAERFLSPARTRNWLGRGSGSKGWLLAVLAGVLSTGPVYAWYALLADLRAKGMRRALVATVLYARAIKLPLLPLLAHYFGLGYVLVLSALLAVFAVVIGWLVERLTPPRTSE
jgi:uncharacterized membrane protein YraQ (UPF0718 family)